MPKTSNPFCELADDGRPLIELKAGLCVYLEDAPGPSTARVVYDLYLRHCGDRIRVYRSTAPSSPRIDWNARSRERFEKIELPDLRQHDDWGYVFSDEQPTDSWLFMFHGYRPVSEAGKASFYRFDFDWQVDQAFLVEFARELADRVPCLSGFGGYYFQGRLAHQRPSFDRMFALAHRYWGVEAHNLDVSVNHMLTGYKSANWLTIIGDQFRNAYPERMALARDAAVAFYDGRHASVLQAEAAPGFGDRNRRERLPGYEAVAKALLPMQIHQHGPFGGDLWDEDNTMRYIRRFTHPDEV